MSRLRGADLQSVPTTVLTITRLPVDEFQRTFLVRTQTLIHSHG
jgi:hypothetical protein